HITHIKDILIRLRISNLKLNPEKYYFGQDRIKFFSYEMSYKEIAISLSKVKTVNDFPIPKNIQALKSFLGLASFSRSNAFKKLKESITTLPIFAHSNNNEKYILYTDALYLTMGAILVQKSNNRIEHIIEYASQTTSFAVKN
ncbi:16329_t:CDS:2, partial [Gigaspora rosea]